MSSIDSWGIALAVAVAGGVGALVGSIISLYVGQRFDTKVRREDQLRRDGDTVGPVMGWLHDAHPDRLVFNANLATQGAVMAELTDKCGRIRGQVLVMSAGHPDETVRGLGRQLDVALHNALTSAGHALNDVLRSKDLDYLPTAKTDHKKASDLAEELLQEVARYAKEGS